MIEFFMKSGHNVFARHIKYARYDVQYTILIGSSPVMSVHAEHCRDAVLGEDVPYFPESACFRYSGEAEQRIRRKMNTLF